MAVAELLRTVETAGGRTVAFATWGDPGGFPILVLHGTPGCRLECWPREELFHELGVYIVTHDRAGYARLLEANRPTLLAELLRQEVAAGIDSGAEFARDRLKLQVEALQSSLKTGAGKQHGAGQRHAPTGALHALCALPALVDERTALRIEQLVMRLAREGK